jgi:hypothetical protein
MRAIFIRFRELKRRVGTRRFNSSFQYGMTGSPS